MFLIRTAFWIALVVLLLPTDEKSQARFSSMASNAVHHAATFCDRNAGTCKKGSELWTMFRVKLDYGVKLALDLAFERGKPEVGRHTASAPLGAKTPGTLSPADRAPLWRGPSRTGA